MSVRLLDVNILLSLLDSAHVHHRAVARWFSSVATADGWATCPITENGLIRILSQANYPNSKQTPALAADLLAGFKAGFAGIHQFWADGISLTDTSLFDLNVLTGSRQTTDVYLAGLAFRNGGRLATFDRGISWRAIRGADASLIEIIPS